MSEASMVMAHVHISNVSKLGSDIPSVNLPPVTTCRSDAPCFKKCYARRGRLAFPRTKSLLERNYDLWRQDPIQFERDVIIAAYPYRYFRWHCSGDIPDLQYLKMMIRVAEAIPDTKFLCFTKKYDLVNGILDSGIVIPQNLNIVFSAWGNFQMDNHHSLPVAYIRFKNNSDQQTQIPASVFQCQNYCGSCVMTGKSCWDLGKNEAVCFNEH